ncbi:uncharacterized protein LOC119571055 [Penaeus monodon]|nr:uncharacterized protein LOC119571055 [Penaeus monodon]
MTTTNALAIHRALGGKLTQFEFRKELVRGLLQQGGPRGSFRRNPPQARHEEEVPQQAHLPVDTPHRRWRRCVLCWRNHRRRKETRVMCSCCGTSLCPAPCFQAFHA